MKYSSIHSEKQILVTLQIEQNITALTITNISVLKPEGIPFNFRTKEKPSDNHTQLNFIDYIHWEMNSCFPPTTESHLA